MAILVPVEELRRATVLGIVFPEGQGLFNQKLEIDILRFNDICCKIAGILRDKTIIEKMTYISNSDKQNYTLFRFKLMVDKFGLYN